MENICFFLLDLFVNVVFPKKITPLAILKKIILTQFKNFKFREFNFSGNIIGITGKNGSGKTNLLDAIYYLCYTKSYFQNREMNNTQQGTEGFRIEGLWQKDLLKSNTIVIWKEGKKTIQHNGDIYQKVTEHIGKFNAVMIAPDDIDIINGGSEVRRKFMDGILAQTDKRYLSNLLGYHRVIQQKNAYLKQCQGVASNDLLDIYDQQLADSGSYLIQERLNLMKQLPFWLKNYYKNISKEAEEISIEYKSSASPENLLGFLKGNRIKDIELKRGSSGPHTEDWLFSLDGKSLKSFASQGQKKTYLISLKLSHLKWLQQSNKAIILLLDDIFEKLDKNRLMSLFEMLKEFSLDQIFMTHTSSEELSELVQQFYGDVDVVELSR